MRVTAPLWATLVLALFRLATAIADHRDKARSDAAARKMLRNINAAKSHDLLMRALEARQKVRAQQRRENARDADGDQESQL